MPPLPPSHPVAVRYCAIVASLARLSDIRSLPLPALHVVMTLRTCALFERVDREPLGELAARLHSVAAAKAVLDLADLVTRFWPERFVTARPCQLKMTADEATVAAMVRAVLNADRPAFGRTLDGFVRADRHARLHQAMVVAVALLQEGSIR